jgi:hypothetical protein
MRIKKTWPMGCRLYRLKRQTSVDHNAGWAPRKKQLTKLREIEDQIARRVYTLKVHPKFSKVAEQWIKYKRANLRESTYSVYKGHTKNHFGELDSLKVNRITTAKIEEFIANRQKKA